jgi:hypothetical protein
MSAGSHLAASAALLFVLFGLPARSPFLGVIYCAVSDVLPRVVSAVEQRACVGESEKASRCLSALPSLMISEKD